MKIDFKVKLNNEDKKEIIEEMKKTSFALRTRQESERINLMANIQFRKFLWEFIHDNIGDILSKVATENKHIYDKDSFFRGGIISSDKKKKTRIKTRAGLVKE